MHPYLHAALIIAPAFGVVATVILFQVRETLDFIAYAQSAADAIRG